MDSSFDSILEFVVRYSAENQQRSFKVNKDTNFDKFKGKLYQQFKIEQRKQLKITVRIPSGNNNSLASMDINNDQLWKSFIQNHSQTFINQSRHVDCFIGNNIHYPCTQSYYYLYVYIIQYSHKDGRSKQC